MHKFTGDWEIVANMTTDEKITITFDAKGVTSYDIEDSIGSYNTTLTPIEQFKFTDNPNYPAYIYEFKIQTDDKTIISYRILWTPDERKILEFNNIFDSLEEAQALTKGLSSTDERIQGIFAKKK